MPDITKQVTFCIKTIRRPWSCFRLVESIFEHVENPKVIVVDDGPEDRRFSLVYPQSAKKCRVIDLDQYDVGIGVGRNELVRAVETEYMFLLDDDHVVTPALNLPFLGERLNNTDIDILGVRQGTGGRPTLLESKEGGKQLCVSRGQHKQEGSVAWCDMAANAFLARAKTIQERCLWDPELKTFEHWEYFYRASHIVGLVVAVAVDCKVEHKHVRNTAYNGLRSRKKFRRMGLRKHGFESMKLADGEVTHA